MTFEAKIYDVTALEIVKRMEVSLHEIAKKQGFHIKNDETLGKQISEFGSHISGCKSFSGYENVVEDVLRLMNKIKDKRNQIVHPARLRSLVDFSPEPYPEIETLGDFEKFRGRCVTLSKLLANKPFEVVSGMDEIMIPTLPYDIGNAGDIIKHGLIAEFCKWWFDSHSSLIFADSFGGSPWGDYKRVENRISKLQNTALNSVYGENAQKGSKYNKYFGSAHLVKKMAEILGKKKKICVCDINKDARSNLKHSGLTMMTLPTNDGYQVFDKQEEYNFNLMLIDPFAEFLRDECYKRNNILNRIYKHVNDHENVYVALFVLDMADNRVHRNFYNFKNDKLKDISVSLRCPKIPKKDTSMIGESNYNSEILLISKQIANSDIKRELMYRLKKFAEQAAEALPLHGKKIEFWPDEENK